MEHLGDKNPRLNGIYWISDAGPCCGVYVLDGGRTLIDAGNMYGLIDEIQDLTDPRKIERVILTHSHFDHVEGLAGIFQVASRDLYMA
ncbi:MAG TPA: MBL fold metallo-hydrolase [Deltaproteobacteria bacterium]|nr:MBL fold metallo-hydrolase [Deltaproteobacteria bacterium]